MTIWIWKPFLNSIHKNNPNTNIFFKNYVPKRQTYIFEKLIHSILSLLKEHAMLPHAGLINSWGKINPSEDWNLQKYSNSQQHKFNSIQAFHSFSKADCMAEKLGSELEIPMCPMVHDHWNSPGQWNSLPSTGLLDQQFSWEKNVKPFLSQYPQVKGHDCLKWQTPTH